MAELQNELQSLGKAYSTGDLAATCDSIEAVWEELFPAERYNLAHQVIDKITLYEDRLVMDVKHHGLKSLIREFKTGNEDFPEEVFEPSAMAKRLAQGYQWMSMIESGKYPTIARLAEELRLDPSIVAKSINMVNLSPKIQKLIVDADTPKAINREKLFCAIPEDWKEQESEFGILKKPAIEI